MSKNDELVTLIGNAINANNGRCPAVEDSLTRAMDVVLQIPGPTGKPGIKVMSVFGQSRFEVTDGDSVISLDLTRKGVERLIEELQAVLEMAD